MRRFLHMALAVSSWLIAAAWSQPLPQRASRSAVGFRVIKTPNLTGDIGVWYPAVASSGRTMTTSDYLTVDVDTNTTARRLFMTGIARNYGGAIGLPSGPRPPDLPDSVARAALAVRGVAVRDARQKPGAYPLVIFTMPLGGTGTADQFLLTEALAAQGHIVVSGPTLGSVPAGTSADDFMDLLTASASRVLDAGMALPGVDSSRVIAFDVTGSTALMMQIERPPLTAAVVFDEMPFTDRHRMAVEHSAPSLHLNVLRFPLGSAPNTVLFSRLPRVTSAADPGATHGLMSAWGTYFKRQLGADTRMYDAAVSRILAFIDSLKS